MKIIRTRKTRTDVPATVVHNAKCIGQGVSKAAVAVSGYTTNVAHRASVNIRYAAFKASKLPEAYRTTMKKRRRQAAVRKVLKALRLSH